MVLDSFGGKGDQDESRKTNLEYHRVAKLLRLRTWSKMVVLDLGYILKVNLVEFAYGVCMRDEIN